MIHETLTDIHQSMIQEIEARLTRMSYLECLMLLEWLDSLDIAVE